jgi:uncharacterized protein
MLRDAGNGNSSYDLELIKEKLLTVDKPFHLFGGEPLLMKISDLEELLAWEFERNGENLIQTNGSILTPKHIELFKKYNVKVGVSIDGPNELNDIRWNGSLESTRSASQKTIETIDILLENGLLIGIQIQVTKCNSNSERLPIMLEWLRNLDEKGLSSARLHILEIDNPIIREKYAFTSEENIEVFSKYHEFEKTLKTLKFDLFKDMRNMLMANDDNSTCTWRACDPYTTEAVEGMDGQGKLSNCGLTDKEGINFQKPNKVGYERYIALYNTPQEYDGCKDCRFFLSCKGQCPGTAINGDSRNKSENCAVWFHFFEKIESEIIDNGGSCISKHPLRKELESLMIKSWSEGINPTLDLLVKNSAINDRYEE